VAARIRERCSKPGVGCPEIYPEIALI
jgi:hypothetical protein